MSTGMTGLEHYREAERLLEEADAWMDVDYGWKANLSADERIARRTADLVAAQVHATLAHTAATALTILSDYGVPESWIAIVSSSVRNPT